MRIIFIFVSLLLAVGAPPSARRAEARERAELVMGSVARIALSDADAAAFEAGFAALREVDAVMSLHRRDSDLVRVNVGAGAGPVVVRPELAALLVRAQALGAAMDGAFDVTILPVLQAWGAYRDLAWLPVGDPGAVGMRGLLVDPASATVRFAHAGMGVDLGGIAKGFAADRARDALVRRGVVRGRLDVAGNLAFVGAGPDEGWRVAVRDPDDPALAAGVLTVPPASAVATSANYFRDFGAEGWRAPTHVYDPRTRAPVRRALAVTAWAPDATTADALSTGLLVLGPEHADRALARLPGAGALLVDGHGPTRRLTFHGAPPRGWEPAAGARPTS